MKCPFCASMTKETLPGDGSDHGAAFQCPQCSDYSLSTALQSMDDNAKPVEDGHLVSGLIRRGRLPKGYFGYPHFASKADIKKAAADAPRRIPDRALALLSAVASKTEYCGHRFQLPVPELLAWAFARNLDELSYLLAYAKENDWLEYSLGGSSCGLLVLPKGFEELEGRQRSNLDSEKAFVAMWFPDEKSEDKVPLERAWLQGIKPAIEAAGFYPTRIDLEQFNEDINDRVKAEIRRSRFLVADCTGNRNGVYFEAGFAMGLSLPVIWLCGKDHFGKAHFDTSHYKHTIWEKPEDIRQALEDRIVSTIGIGPLKAHTGG